MRYQSIIRFFEFAHIDYAIPENFNLTRAKKLVNAEFAMQADGIIVIDGFSYTKQNILAELERADFLHRLDFHKHVWTNPSLLDLLEKDKVNLSQQPSWLYLSYAPHFKEFISEYFAAVFDRVMRALLNTQNLYNAAIWLDYLQFVTPEQEEEALRSVRLYMDDVVKFFRNLNDESYKSRDAALSMWYNSNWSAFTNKLPDSMLGFIDELISAIVNFTVRIQKSNREICLKISNEMLLVTNANYSLKQLVRSNHESYRQNVEKRTVKGRFRNINYAYVIVVVVLFVLRFAMGSSSSDGDIVRHFNETPVALQQKNTTETTVVDVSQNPGNASLYAQRSEYAKIFQMLSAKGFQTMSNEGLRKMPFDATQLYLFLEGHNSGNTNLDTIGFENLTRKTIIVDIIWSGDVYHHKLEPDSYIGFRMALDKNLDVRLSFKALSDTSMNVPENKIVSQYIHIRGNTEKPFTKITDEFGTPDEMPYLLHSQLRELPVYVKINQDGDKIFYDIQTKGSILSAHSSLN